MQSQYYSQTQASIHVTVLHRHAIKDLDGVDSTLEEPVIVTEHIFVISPDTKHDHDSVHQVRKLVADYLEDIKYDVEVMHECTDGCSAQQKSRHCMGMFPFPTQTLATEQFAITLKCHTLKVCKIAQGLI